ncbi:MAG: TIGR02147 family protein [Myxococcota bacterium]
MSDELDYRGFLRARIADDAACDHLAHTLSRPRDWLGAMLAGSRALEPSLAPTVATALQLHEPARSTFLALVALEASDSTLARRRALATIRAAGARRSPTRCREEAAFALRWWFVSAILELSRCEGFEPDPQWIARTLNPPVTSVEAARALTVLVRFDLLDDEGRARPGATFAPLIDQLGTVTEIARAARPFHRQTLSLAKQADDRFSGPERHVGTSCMAMSDARYQALRERVRSLIPDLLAELGEDEGGARRVYGFSIALFPMSAHTDEG